MLNVNTSYLQDLLCYKRCIYKLSEVLRRFESDLIWKYEPGDALLSERFS